MSGIIFPRNQQIMNTTSQIGQAVQSIMREQEMGAFHFAIVFWQRQQPVVAERILLTAPPEANLEELHEVLGVCRTQLELRKSSRK